MDAPAAKRARCAAGLADLSDELLLRVFSFLDAVTVYRCARVCRQWHAVSHDRDLWELVARREWHAELGPIPFIVRNRGDWEAICRYWHRTRLSSPTKEHFFRRLRSVHTTETSQKELVIYETSNRLPRLIHSFTWDYYLPGRMQISVFVQFGRPLEKRRPGEDGFLSEWTGLLVRKGPAVTLENAFFVPENKKTSFVFKPTHPVYASAMRVMWMADGVPVDREDPRRFGCEWLDVHYTPINHFPTVKDAAQAWWDAETARLERRVAEGVARDNAQS